MAKKLTEEELAKLTPEQRAVILEERRRQEEIKRKKEEEQKEEAKRAERGLTRYFVIVMVICACLIGGGSLISYFSKSDEEKIEKYIEEYNFAEARKVLAKMDKETVTIKDEEQKSDQEKKIRGYKQQITKAEITYFLDEGDYEKAYDSARDGGQTNYYESSVLSRIPKVYQEKGTSALITFLSSIVFPKQDNFTRYTEEFINSQKDPEMRATMRQNNKMMDDLDSYKSFVKEYNSALSNVIKAVELEGKKDDAALLKKLLK